MRGRRDPQPSMFYAIDVEDRIRPDHPLRPVKATVDRLLATLSDRFDQAYSDTGRPGVPPERLFKALLLQALYSVRSERQLVERIDTDLLFRWFLDMSPEEPAFDATAFSHNRKRLDEHGLTAAFFEAVRDEALSAGLCSEHFSVDGTLIDSYASTKSLRPVAASPPGPPDAEGSPSPPPASGGGPDGNGFKPRNPEIDFRGQKRSNAMHRSSTDPEARLYRKSNGQETKLRRLGHTLGENRHGLIVGVVVTEANGTAEREAALDLVDAFAAATGRPVATLGMDKGYDGGPLLRELESRGVEPHLAMDKAPVRPVAEVRPHEREDAAARHRMFARTAGERYRLSQKCRKKIEEGFGWLKEVAGLGRSRVAKRWKIQQLWEIGAAAYNLVRLRKLMATA